VNSIFAAARRLQSRHGIYARPVRGADGEVELHVWGTSSRNANKPAQFRIRNTKSGCWVDEASKLTVANSNEDLVSKIAVIVSFTERK
jgi:hypothetical protein